MEWLRIVLDLLVLGGLWVTVRVMRRYLTAYATEKGKNLATKEDIEEITRKIEGVRAELQAVTHERATRFVRRVRAMDGLYRRVARTEEAFGAFSYYGDREARIQRAGEGAKELRRYYSENRLYLPGEVREAFARFEGKLFDAWWFYAAPPEVEPDHSTREERERYVEELRAANAIIRKELPALRDEIESRMRIALGDVEVA